MLRMALLGLALATVVVRGEPPGADPVMEKTDLFQAGEGGYAFYRIPGIVVTARGAVLAYCEARRDSISDWGAIDVQLRRSLDGGRTWQAARKITSPPEDAARNPLATAKKLGTEGNITVGNPVAIPDKSGAVHFLYCVEYARCFYMRSDDDGASFTRPVEITAVFDRYRAEFAWKILATGPGHGVQLRSGRLIVPAWLSLGTGPNAHGSSCNTTIYSDDGGRTWQRGAIVASDPEPKNPSETAAVELSDGRVMLNFRHESRPRGRGVAIGPDGAGGWSRPAFDDALPEPICMGSMIRVPAADRWRILFSNPHNPENTRRRNLSVKLSYDDGLTWPLQRSIEEGPSGYSDLAASTDGWIYCFYERGNRASLCVARFNLAWLGEK